MSKPKGELQSKNFNLKAKGEGRECEGKEKRRECDGRQDGHSTQENQCACRRPRKALHKGWFSQG